MSRGRTTTMLARRHGSSEGRSPHVVIVEEPMSIHLDGTLVATTMRTPGHDFELAVGFCHTEGLLAGAPVRACRYCSDESSAADSDFNAVSVDTGGVAPAPTPRLGPTTSACGVCGTASVEALLERLEPIDRVARVPPEVLAGVGEKVRDQQELFSATGAVHAAAAFEPDGSVSLVREDIGRHNAVDKVVGRLVLDGGVPATAVGLFASGRVSFEIVQKAWAAGIGTIVAVSGPSSLAVETARAAGIVLAGFARGGSLTVYSE